MVLRGFQGRASVSRLRIRRAPAVLLATLAFLGSNRQGADGATWAPQQPREITGASEPVPSPDGRLELLWRRNEAEGVHEIWLRPAGDHTRARRIYSFNRSASVLWSPSGGMVAITDRRYSDESRVTLFRVFADREPREVTAVPRSIERLFADKRGQLAFDHSYAEAVRWSRDSRRLRIHTWAYGADDRKPRRLDRLITVKIPPPEHSE